MQTEILIVGSGVAGLYAALNIPKEKKILIITKSDAQSSDSYLAQGGICMLRDDNDYDAFFEDTMKAGHYENNKESVDIMIRSSQDVIHDLIGFGVEFEKVNGELAFTREAAHSNYRILYHEDITGEEITSKLLKQVQSRDNITLMEYTTMIDLIEKDNKCYGIAASDEDGRVFPIFAEHTLLACGGIGGLFAHSTNFPHLTGDGLAVCLKHNVELLHPDYIQIHPTTLYSRRPGRAFLISESVRGEGALLYDIHGNRFVNELLPRDVVAQAIFKQMEKDGSDHVYLDMRPIGEKDILEHFPHIYERCIEEGYKPLEEPVPIVPAQHYFMGGIKVDRYSQTTMDNLYAAGETSCNGVHGANRLASNSLLESLVFARRAALHMLEDEKTSITEDVCSLYSPDQYKDLDKLAEDYGTLVKNEIERIKKLHE